MKNSIIMKIGLVCPASLPATQFGGILFLALDIARETAKLSHDVVIYTTDLDFANNATTFNKKLPREESIGDFTIKRSHTWLRYSLFFINPGIYFQLLGDSPDIIHTIGIRSFQSFIAALVSKQKKIPLVATIHHPITQDHNLSLQVAKNWKERLSTNRWHSFLRMQKKVAPKLNQIICPSEQSKEDVEKEFKVEGANIEVVLNGIDLDAFRENKGIKKVPFRIITTASADIPLKGLRFLIEAMIGIIDEFPEAHLAVIGKAKEEGETVQQISKLNLKEKVSFHSELSQSEIVSLYSSAHISVIPSLYEGFGFGAAEAMACGLPLISTHSGGLKEVVGQDASIIEPGSSKVIVSAVKDLFSSQEKQLTLSKMGRERMEREFNWKKAARAYERIYVRAVEEFHN
mgnify:CR=1 FL=1